MREMIEEMVDEMLDLQGDVVIGNLTFSRSSIVREMDPTAYRELCNDFADSMISDLQDELDCLDPEVDEEEIADIKERIGLLESI